MTTTSTSRVKTDRPARYAKQLVSHVSRRAQGAWDDERNVGEIQFPASACRLRCGHGVLLLELTARPEDLDQMEGVVGRHLVRFGARDELRVQWTRADETPGTLQVNDGSESGPRPTERS